MKKSRFTETRIVEILKEVEGGIAMADILRTHGINGPTFYKRRSKYCGLEASELKRVKELEQQLSEYKTMVAKLTHNSRALKNLIEKKLYRQPVKEMRSITWLAKKQYPLQGLALIWGWLGHRITSAQ